MAELLTPEDLVALMRAICESRDPLARWEIYPFGLDDLAPNQWGWSDVGWAVASNRDTYDVWVHWERRVGRLVPAKAYG